MISSKYTLKAKLEDLIFDTVFKLNDGLTDDIYQDMIQDPDKIAEACDHLIEQLENYKENGEL